MYTNIWNDGLPSGVEAANTIDDIFRSLKVDIEERFSDVFSLGAPAGVTFAADPLRLFGLKFGDAVDSVINYGDNAGILRKILIKDKAGINTYLTLGSSPALTINSGGLAVLSGTSSFQSVTATSITSTSSVSASLSFISGSIGSGTGGASKYVDDAGNTRYQVGLLNTAGAIDFVIRDIVNNITRLSIDNASGKAIFSGDLVCRDISPTNNVNLANQKAITIADSGAVVRNIATLDDQDRLLFGSTILIPNTTVNINYDVCTFAGNATVKTYLIVAHIQNASGGQCAGFYLLYLNAPATSIMQTTLLTSGGIVSFTFDGASHTLRVAQNLASTRDIAINIIRVL